MGFWSSTESEPLRKYRFKVTGLTEDIHLVKSVTLPTFEVNQNSYQVLNHMTKVAGVLSWQDITITLVADSKTLEKITALVHNNGHNWNPASPKGGIVSNFKGPLQEKMLIELLDKSGAKAGQAFELNDWFISGISYGELDYSDDELYTIEITISYEWCDIK